jgi:hypothetical protein
MRFLIALVLLLPAFSYAEDVALILELQARIQQLVAQISAVKLELEVAEENQIPQTAACPELARTLRFGMTGTDVRDLQRFLTQTGDFTLLETTQYFGAKTRDAVSAFQCREMGVCRNDLGSGIVGPRTRDAIARKCVDSMVEESPSAGSSEGGALVCGQPPITSCGEGVSCIVDMPAAKTYHDDAARVAAGAALLHIGVCTCGDNGIACFGAASKSCDFWGQTIGHGVSVPAFRQGLVAAVSLCESEIRTCTDGILSGSYEFATCAFVR